MNDPLVTYLHDHLAGSHFAIKLLGSLSEQYERDELGHFARSLRAEVQQDQDALQAIIDKVGKMSFDITEAAGWIGEKASQLKLHRDSAGKGIGTFEALETLTVGIQGKLALWRVLPLIREIDARVPEKDFVQLAARAQDQHSRVEEWRLRTARSTFEPARKSSAG